MGMGLEECMIIKNLNKLNKLDEEFEEIDDRSKYRRETIVEEKEELVNKNKTYLNDLLNKGNYEEVNVFSIGENNFFYSRKKEDGSIDMVAITNFDSTKMNLVYINIQKKQKKDFVKKKVFLDNPEKYIQSSNKFLDGLVGAGASLGVGVFAVYGMFYGPTILNVVGFFGSIATLFGADYYLPGFFKSRGKSKVDKISHDFKEKYKITNGTKNVFYSDVFKPLKPLGSIT